MRYRWGTGCMILAALLLVLGTGCAARPSADGGARPTSAPRRVVGGPAKLASNVDVYAKVAVGNRQLCEVGAKLQGDLLRERPVAYLGNAEGSFVWQVALPIPPHFYQGRATHCVASARTVFVLLQLDTSSQQSMNQTVLQVVTLDRGTGVRTAMREVDVPGVVEPYTSWVPPGVQHFRLQGGQLMIAGNYEVLSQRNGEAGTTPVRFVVSLPATPQQ